MVRPFEQREARIFTRLLGVWQPEKPSPTDEDSERYEEELDSNWRSACAATIAAESLSLGGGANVQVGNCGGKGNEVIAMGGAVASRALGLRDVLETASRSWGASPSEQSLSDGSPRD